MWFRLLVLAILGTVLLQCDSPETPQSGGIVLTASVRRGVDGIAELLARVENRTGVPIQYLQNVCDSLGVFVRFDGPNHLDLRVRNPRGEELCPALSRVAPKDAILEGTIPLSGFLFDIDNHSVPMDEGRWTAVLSFPFSDTAAEVLDQRVERQISFDWQVTNASNQPLQLPGAAWGDWE